MAEIDERRITENPTARSTLIDRQALIVALLVVAISALTLVIARWRFGTSFLTENDAGIYLRIARDPFGHGATLAGLPFGSGSSYRYGRILYPFAAWLLAGGRPGLVIWTLPIVYVFGLGLLGATAAELAARRGFRPEWGLVAFLCPAFWLTFPVLFPDAFVTGLILLTFLYWIDGRRAGAQVVASLALLAREISVIAVLPLILLTYRRRGAKAAASWLAILVPMAGWWVWVRARFGTWPFTDPAYARRGALSGPLMGVVRTIQEGKLHRPLYVFALVLFFLTVALAVWVWRRRPWTPLTQAALLLGVLLLFLGPGALRLPGAAIRLMLPAQVFIALSIVTYRRPAQTL